MSLPPEKSGDDKHLRWALKQAALRQAQLRRLETDPNTGLVIPTTARNAVLSPEHYHIIYNVPKEEVQFPDFHRVFIEAKDAYQAICDMGMKAQPNCEFYEDGQIGIETRLHGRADLWWIVLEVAACIRSVCTQSVEREKLKRQFVIVPEVQDASD